MIMGSMIGIFKHIKARTLTQIGGLVGLNAYFFQFRSVCFPAFNCHSCPAATFACPLGVMVNFSSLHIIPWLAIGIIGLAALIGGRIFCGWICPFGFLQDILYKIPSPKFTLPAWSGYLKYVILVVTIFVIPFLIPSSVFVFCRLCPAGTLESSIVWRAMGVVKTYPPMFFIRLGILAFVILAAVAVSRSFCRVICPLGAILALFNRISLFRATTIKPCSTCGVCVMHCPVEINPVEDINTEECIKCMDCNKIKCFKLGLH